MATRFTSVGKSLRKEIYRGKQQEQARDHFPSFDPGAKV
jgi:hypothetical protein